MNIGRRVSVCVCALVLSSFASAEKPFSAELSLGQFHVNGGGYEDALAYDIALSYTNFLSYRLGALEVKNVVVDGDNENSASYLDVDGLYLGVYKSIDWGFVSLDLGGGAFRGDVDAFYLGESVGNESELRPYLNGKIIIPIAGLNWFSAHIDFKYIDDLAASDLSVASAGVRFSF